MNFIITAGAVAPTRPVNYTHSVTAPAPLRNSREAFDRSA